MRLEKIARAAGVMPSGINITRKFGDCKTAKERYNRMLDLLKEAGMKGELPSTSDET